MTSPAQASRPAHTPEKVFPDVCDYCHGIGACPKCWGRAGIEKLYDERDSLRALNEEMAKEMTRSLSWLTSYPGGGALPTYERFRALLARIDKEKK